MGRCMKTVENHCSTDTKLHYYYIGVREFRSFAFGDYHSDLLLMSAIYRWILHYTWRHLQTAASLPSPLIWSSIASSFVLSLLSFHKFDPYFLVQDRSSMENVICESSWPLSQVPYREAICQWYLHRPCTTEQRWPRVWCADPRRSRGLPTPAGFCIFVSDPESNICEKPNRIGGHF